MDEEKPKIKKWQVIFLALFLVGFLGIKFYLQNHYPVGTVYLKGVELEVEYAKTIEQAYKGLGGRKEFGKHDGMIFLFSEPGKHAMVMRDMNFPIDIVWLYQGEVVDIAPNVPIEPGVEERYLRRYSPRIEATIVLELPAGWAEKHGLKIGDGLELP